MGFRWTPCRPISVRPLTVEQECQRKLREQHIEMSIFLWMSRQVDSDYLRASALSRNGLATRAFTVGTFYHAGTVGVRTNTTKFPGSTALLAHMVRACTHTPFTAVSMLCNVHVRTHRDKYNMQDTLNILIPVTKFRQGQIWIEEENKDQICRREVSAEDANMWSSCQASSLAPSPSTAPALEVRPHRPLSVHRAQSRRDLQQRQDVP